MTAGQPEPSPSTLRVDALLHEMKVVAEHLHNNGRLQLELVRAFLVTYIDSLEEYPMNHDPIGADTADLRRQRRRGADTVCAVCDDPCADDMILEEHHVAGRNNDPDTTVFVHPHCHRRLHAQMRRAGVDLGTCPDQRLPVEKIVDRLAGHGVYQAESGTVLQRIATALESFISRVLTEVPESRDWPEAHCD